VALKVSGVDGIVVDKISRPRYARVGDLPTPFMTLLLCLWGLCQSIQGLRTGTAKQR